MNINFESIVSHLFIDHVDKKYPLNYFKREFLKAQKENYDAETFFNLCLDVINSMEGEMDFQFYNVHPGYITKYFDEPTKDFAEQLIKTPRNDFDFQLIRNIENQNIRIIVFCEDFLKIKDAINVTYKEALNSEKLNLSELSCKSINDKLTINQQKVLKPLIINPTFKPEAINQIFDLIKINFYKKDQELLNKVLITGVLPNTKLLFIGNGKTLLDFFKQLMTGQFLIIAVQKDFESWISNGFEFLYRGNRKGITQKYASKIISGNERAAKGNRLIDIKSESGKFVIVQLEIKNRVQN